MDWESIATQLSHEPQPALAVDAGGRVRVVNAPLERLVSRRLEDLSNKRWLASCVPPSGWAGVKRLFDAGLRGETNGGDVPLVTRAGQRLTMRAELSRATHGRSRALIVVGRGLRESEPHTAAAGDCWCLISRGASRAAGVIDLRFLDPSRDAAPFVGNPASELLDSLSLGDALGSVESVVAMRATETSSVVMPEVDDAFRVVTTRAVDEESAVLTIRCIDAGLLPAMVDAKAARIAGAGALSERERQVLILLLRGHGVQDVASMLEIAPRTVKFHQSNVLQKLGADSRIDLLRVVLQPPYS
jgi:DNA-binding CsgD family transcriptional regulator